MYIAVVGIGTEIGKTVVSAILTESLEADYWKPIQAGGLEASDSMFVASFISNKVTRVHSEAFRLKSPISPHEAARRERISIMMESLSLPQTKNNLIIETAGGVMSPINDSQTFLDFLSFYNLPVVLVSKNYLGSINHTLLTIHALKSQNIKILGIIFNGELNPASEAYCVSKIDCPMLGRVEKVDEISREFVVRHAKSLKPALNKMIDKYGSH